MQNLTQTNTKVWVRFENLDPTQTDPILRVRLGWSGLNLTRCAVYLQVDCATGCGYPAQPGKNPPCGAGLGCYFGNPTHPLGGFSVLNLPK